MPDFLSNRFHEKKKVIMAIASVFILVFFAVYAGSFFVTCGKLFSKLFGQNYQLMMVVGALFVLLYTFLGGFHAVLENARQIPGFFDFFFTATPQVDANGVQQLTAAGQVFFWKLVLKPLGGLWGIYELLPAFLFSCLLIVVVSLLTPAPSQEIQDEFEKAKTID